MSNYRQYQEYSRRRVRPERIPLKPLSLDTRSLALTDGETAIEKLRARVAELRAIEGASHESTPESNFSTGQDAAGHKQGSDNVPNQAHDSMDDLLVGFQERGPSRQYPHSSAK
jgi:hypothetical protein